LGRAAQTRHELQLALVNGGRVDVPALRDLAQSEFADGRPDRAAAALIQILRQQPDDRDALHLLGEIQVRSKLRVTQERLLPRSLRTPPAAGHSVAGRPGE
jgi:hypothetical protein